MEHQSKVNQSKVNQAKANLANVNRAELAKFSKQAGSWWQPNGGFKALHQINPVRLAYIRRRAGLSDKTVLDVGCGGGLLSEAMARQGARVTGIDMEVEALETARVHADRTGLAIDYVQGTAESWAEGHTQFYDIITCMELVEHVPDPGSLVRACAELIRPGGDVFFSTVNRTWLAYLLVILASEYLLRIVPRGTHHYDGFVHPSTMARWAEQSGLTIIDLTGLRYLPFIGYAALCRDTRMNYMMHFKKPSWQAQAPRE
jgi:2-polyprenyl-6-hydroxyphenyl methylase/3-demethylubiquinone-9 3-methyltransferase